jgi:hypothetical protein
MKVVHHRLVRSDATGIVRHVFETSGDHGAAARREREISDLIVSIAANPHSGLRHRGKLDGWLVR